jgi:arylsulfatase A
MMMGMLTTVILAGAWAASPATSDAAPGETDHPHIVILFVDDMGYGDAGCYNSESKIPTPHIDGLAVPGCVSPTRTLPDRCAIPPATDC